MSYPTFYHCSYAFLRNVSAKTFSEKEREREREREKETPAIWNSRLFLHRCSSTFSGVGKLPRHLHARARVCTNTRDGHSNGWPLCACESVKIGAARKGRPVIRRNDGLHCRVSAMKMIEIGPKMRLTKCLLASTIYFHARTCFPSDRIRGHANVKLLPSTAISARS